MADISQRIKLEGEAEYRKALKEIQSQAKLSDSELKKLSSSFDENTSEEEKAAKMSEAYAQKLEVQKKQIDLMRDQLQKATAAYGENSEYVTKLKTSLNNAETAYNKTSAEAKSMGNSVQDSGKEMDKASDKALSFGDVLKANLASEAIVAGIKGIVNGVKQLGSALKSVVTDSAAFADEILTESTVTGLSTDALQEYKYMAELTDTSVDTITGSMTKLIKNMSTARKGTGDAADAFSALGISITDSNGELRNNQEVFEEALAALSSIENETQADAYAMQIFGKSAQDLKPLMAVGAEGLASLREEAHATGYVLDEMSLQSLGAVDDAFQRMENATTSLKNNLAVAFAPAVEQMVSGITEMGSKMMEAYQTNGVDGVMQLSTDMITNLATNISEKAPAMIQQGADLLMKLLDGIYENLPQIMEAVGTIVSSLGTALVNNLPKILVMGVKIVLKIVAGLIQAIPKLVAAIPQLIKGIVQAFIDNKDEILGIGKDIVNGIWEGIQSLASWFADKVSDFFGGIVDGVKDFLGIHSPSKVFAEIGKYSAEGFGVGFEKSFSGTSNSVVAQVAKAPVTLYNSFNFSGGYTQADGQNIVRQINRQLGALYV